VNGRRILGGRCIREKDFWNFGREHYFEIRTVRLVFFWSGVWVDCYRGASVAGSFGLGG
jgi:hypothetical protein